MSCGHQHEMNPSWQPCPSSLADSQWECPKCRGQMQVMVIIGGAGPTADEDIQTLLEIAATGVPREPEPMVHKQHRCMRCLEVFDCPAPERCDAQFDVLPAPPTAIFPHRCPEQPTWDYVRKRLEALAVRPVVQRDDDHCGECGGHCAFEASVPSVLWNRVVRPLGGSEYLCLACIVKAFARAGVSFTAELSGDGFHGLPIAVEINGAVSTAPQELNEENNRLRVQLHEATIGKPQ